MYRNQIDLDDKELEKNIIFMKKLYSADIIEPNMLFYSMDKTAPKGYSRDFDMDIKKFMKHANDFSLVKLMVGSPDFKTIQYIAFTKSDGRALLECPYNENNYAALTKIFESVFGQELESIPLAKGLDHYNNKIAEGYDWKL